MVNNSTSNFRKKILIFIWFWLAKILRKSRISVRQSRLLCFVKYLSQIQPSAQLYATSKTALVVSLRGFWEEHREHELIISKALLNLGYDTQHLVCPGGMSYCAMEHVGMKHFGYPRHCGECNMYGSITFENIKTHSAMKGSNRQNFLSDTEILELSRYGILRHTLGDFKDDRFRKQFITSGHLYSNWFADAIDRIKPDLVVLFNGLFFPERILLEICRKKSIKVICHERGMRKNSIFISIDEPACDYRADQIWTKWSRNLERLDIINYSRRGRHYLLKRLRGPEDPHGIARHRHRGLTLETPGDYFVFFPSVGHDTASMGKEGVLGGLYESALVLCAAAESSKRVLVIRTHPDDINPAFPSRLPLEEFLRSQGVDGNFVKFISASEPIDSYRLAWRAAGCFVYNGTLGIELPALGVPVVNLGRSHYCNKGFTEELADKANLDQVFSRRGIRRLNRDERLTAQLYLHFYVEEANLSTYSLSVDEKQDFLDLSVTKPNYDQFSAIEARISELLSSN